MQTLTAQERTELRRQAQSIRPIVRIGNAGITDAIVDQVRVALKKHRVMKARIRGRDRDETEHMARELCRRVPCQLVARTGFVAVLYSGEPVTGIPAGKEIA